jgi:hypothetical protein
MRFARLWTFAAICAGCIAATAIYIVLTGPATLSSGRSGATYASLVADRVPDGPLLLFRNLEPGARYGRVGLVPLPVGGAPRLLTRLACDRLHYSAGWGVCLGTEDGPLDDRHIAYIFDRTLTRRHTVELTGIPTRARISPDGRLAAVTVFEKGHSYAEHGFSTRTTLVQTATGRAIPDLEEFAVTRGRAPFKQPDFNFWGVTFDGDSKRFFATLASGGENYLIDADVADETATVVRSGVECPSLAPDREHFVYKKRLADGTGWQLYVSDRHGTREHALNQRTRSIDDQVDWYDNEHVVYHDSAEGGTAIWMLSIDGTSPPTLLLPQAYSPSVVH